jgi:hypothetical protein
MNQLQVAIIRVQMGVKEVVGIRVNSHVRRVAAAAVQVGVHPHVQVGVLAHVQVGVQVHV